MEKQRNKVVILQPALNHRLRLRATALDEAASGRGRIQAEGFKQGLGTLPVPPGVESQLHVAAAVAITLARLEDER